MISDGEWLAVQGRTGHGKSTLLNLRAGVMSKGRLTIRQDAPAASGAGAAGGPEHGRA